MRKLFLFFIFSNILFAASNVALRKMYVDELLHYSLELPKKIYNPFIFDDNTSKKLEKNISLNKQLENLKNKKKEKIQNLELLSILNNKLLVKLDDNIKWIKVGDKIGDYKILRILAQSKILVLYKNTETKIIKLKNDNINIHIKVIK